MGDMNGILNTYAGWAGDLITLAGEVQGLVDANPNIDIDQATKDLMSGKKGASTFSRGDLLADIDAVLISDSLKSMPIHEALEAYYTSGYQNRYESFIQKEFFGNEKTIEYVAGNYLNPSIPTAMFKEMFDSPYNINVVPGVSRGFADYIRSQVGR